jgi:hypothetical protein
MPEEVLERHARHQKPATHSKGRDIAGADEVVRAPARDPKKIAGFRHGVCEALQHRHRASFGFGHLWPESVEGRWSSACATTFPLTFPLTFPRAEILRISWLGRTRDRQSAPWDQTREVGINRWHAVGAWEWDSGSWDPVPRVDATPCFRDARPSCLREAW